MVSIGIGANNGIGGEVKTAYYGEGSLRGSTLEIDGARIIKDGQIQI